MRLHKLTRTELLKAIGIGIATVLLLSAVMVPALRLGISPLPKPLGLAFAETVLGRTLPLPVGLLFHVAYVTAWAVVYVALSHPGCSRRRLARGPDRRPLCRPRTGPPGYLGESAILH